MRTFVFGLGLEVITFVLGLKIQEIPNWAIVALAIGGVGLMVFGAWRSIVTPFRVARRLRIVRLPDDVEGTPPAKEASSGVTATAQANAPRVVIENDAPPRGAVGMSGRLIANYRSGPQSKHRMPTVHFKTANAGAHHVPTTGRPRALRFTHPVEKTVGEDSLPVELDCGNGGRLIIKRFTADGFTVEEINTSETEVIAEVYYEEARSASEGRDLGTRPYAGASWGGRMALNGYVDVYGPFCPRDDGELRFQHREGHDKTLYKLDDERNIGRLHGISALVAAVTSGGPGIAVCPKCSNKYPLGANDLAGPLVMGDLREKVRAEFKRSAPQT